MKLKRAISVEELLRMKFDMMPFEGEWKDFLGTPERSGTIMIWGHSGNGKTRFTLQLAKHLTNFGKVAYMPLEERARRSFQKAVDETNMISVKNRITILPPETFQELSYRLTKQKSPDIIIIDSLQYWDLTNAKYKQFQKDHPKKLIVFTSHASGKEPKGTLAEAIRYDADIKIWVQGYRAFPVSRFGGGKPYTIWEEQANEYWTKNS